MTYLKYIQYFYLFAAVFFIYVGIESYTSGEKSPWIMFLFAGLAVFMFFFRRKFLKQYEDKNKKK